MLRNIAIATAASTLAALLYFGANAQQSGELEKRPGETKYSNVTNPPASGQYLSEGQALGFFAAVNDGEIEAARLALERSKNEDVRAYAQRMIDEHDGVRQKLDGFGVRSAVSDERRRVIDRSKATAARLKRLQGVQFDRAYMAAEVEDHRMALEKIDQKILPNAKSGDFGSFARDQRPVIESHLDEARRIQDRIR